MANKLFVYHYLFISFMNRLSSFLNSFSIVMTDLFEDYERLVSALSCGLSEVEPSFPGSLAFFCCLQS